MSQYYHQHCSYTDEPYSPNEKTKRTHFLYNVFFSKNGIVYIGRQPMCRIACNKMVDFMKFIIIIIITPETPTKIYPPT